MLAKVLSYGLSGINGYILKWMKKNLKNIAH